MRKLKTNKGVWHYLVGKSQAVLVDPGGKKETVALSALTGRSSDTIEHGRYKQTRDGMITPGDVRQFIEKQR